MWASCRNDVAGAVVVSTKHKLRGIRRACSLVAFAHRANKHVACIALFVVACNAASLNTRIFVRSFIVVCARRGRRRQAGDLRQQRLGVVGITRHSLRRLNVGAARTDGFRYDVDNYRSQVALVHDRGLIEQTLVNMVWYGGGG